MFAFFCFFYTSGYDIPPGNLLARRQAVSGGRASPCAVTIVSYFDIHYIDVYAYACPDIHYIDVYAYACHLVVLPLYTTCVCAIDEHCSRSTLQRMCAQQIIVFYNFFYLNIVQGVRHNVCVHNRLLFKQSSIVHTYCAHKLSIVRNIAYCAHICWNTTCVCTTDHCSWSTTQDMCAHILCHIIIHTMSHHHTYYVTSSHCSWRTTQDMCARQSIVQAVLYCAHIVHTSCAHIC